MFLKHFYKMDYVYKLHERGNKTCNKMSNRLFSQAQCVKKNEYIPCIYDILYNVYLFTQS